MTSALALIAGCNGAGEGIVIGTVAGIRPSVELSSAGGITSPDGLYTVDGALIIADEGGSAIRRYDLAMAVVETLCDRESGIRSPESIVVAPDGTIYFSDDDAGGVWVVEAEGRCRSLTGPNSLLSSTEGIGMRPDGTILVGDGKSGGVYAVSPQGEVSEFIGPADGIRKPESIVVGPGGEIHIADNADNVLYRWSGERGLEQLIANRRQFSPESLWLLGKDLFISDSVHGKLYRLGDSGELSVVATFGGNLRNVQGVSVDSLGRIFVSIQSDLDEGRGYILRLEPGVT